MDLFAIASYNSNWFFARVARKQYEPVRVEGDCREDKWARVLLNGGTVRFYDAYAEGEEDFYGDLRHEYSWDDEAMYYFVTLDDVKVGLIKAWDKDEHSQSLVKKLFEDAALIDNTDAEDLVQYIMFGKPIYG